jgi:hypothetical protein
LPASVSLHEGVPVVVLQAVQPPQVDSEDAELSQPPVFGAVVLQSSKPALQV